MDAAGAETVTGLRKLDRISSGHVALDGKRTRLSLFFDSDQDNHHTDIEIGDNRAMVSHKLRQLADLVDAGASAEELEFLHTNYTDNEDDKTVHDVAEYLRQRLVALEHFTHLLKRQSAQRRLAIAGDIEIECRRIRWAIGHLENPKL